MNFNEFIIALPKIKNIPLPAEASQLKMVPSYRQELVTQQGENIKKARQSAVLALFYPDLDAQTKLILILRKTYKGVHSGQVGFPGGKVELEDKDLMYTALRETHEEVGVHPKLVTVYKKMTQVYIPPSNFNVQPYIGAATQTPIFTKQDDEVEDLLEVYLSDLLDDNNVTSKKVKTSYGADVEVPAFNLGTHLVWGATAMMLSEVKDLLKATL
ncbi:NUDIX hydrolase [Psychroserpens sp. NJDZ02]|uniref:NUDIX hydrolase n=1 Tax=Psychroserpens sp. NJDZ02 TaxID=2570561 RepID=UPI0010A84525|nr:CoA pyrophosphatase [Psychroserpens sp. NJDZ02]QCE42153.1 CoA pyrophosphatase [Psychroserpens sp. NJDZ02]